ncbi:hypothetical protein [Aquimarina sp. Aq78]|uniref:hypothetical protein n=1 Tax=Aquimarina sp. Aq78 TaxID=1191889 RepID=UPI00131C7EE5|nr:hypothetical protein [Aquimarina sp. Aq78]
MSNTQTTSNSKVSISYSGDESGEGYYRINISITNTEDLIDMFDDFKDIIKE